MLSAETIRANVNRYLDLVARGNADELTALYAENATVEDPVGTDVRRDQAAIREFYAAIENLGRGTELLSLKVAGNEAAFLWRFTMTAGDTRSQIEAIDTMAFNDYGKITSMRAFWSVDDMKLIDG
ncbi:nuclear transport factor 2 family protein [Mycobacterium sp.]|uniref:nuclear transport factor 2 family protein n=1 Tax=Mycobacterium sp. TaxID=1785 RepID=UPI003BABE90B